LRYTGTKALLSRIATVGGIRFIPAVALAVVLAGCGQSGSTSSTRTTAKKATHAAGGAATLRTCSTSQLAVWLGLGEGGAAAGSVYYPLEFTNVSRHACRLLGFPGVSAAGRHQLGSPAQRNRAVAPHAVNLAPGATAHTVIQLSDVLNFPAARCKPATASFLRVYPPDQRRAQDIPFRFRACSAEGPIYLSVEPIQPGVGIPGA
jgi:hypothetical protein